MTSANVGKCQTVLCRNGKPLPLSASYVMSCEEELKRIKQHKAIVTEVRRNVAAWIGEEGWAKAETRREQLPSKNVVEVGLNLELQIQNDTEQIACPAYPKTFNEEEIQAFLCARCLAEYRLGDTTI